MAFACIGLGSNLNEPSLQVSEAFRLLAALPETRILQCSRLYQTAPWGVEEQPDFINAVAGLETNLDPLQLLDELQRIETEQGRVRDQKWGARVLDLDIICYDQLHLETDRLKLPHPFFAERAFVLEPLAELYPDVLISGKPVKQWLQQLRKDNNA